MPRPHRRPFYGHVPQQPAWTMFFPPSVFSLRLNSGSPRPITSEVSRNRAILPRRREACGIFHGRKVYSRRSATTARLDFRNVTVTNVELLKLGLRIRASRRVLGWTQKRFSSNCGLGRSYFGGVERGKRNMTFSVLCQICDSLSCDIATVTKGIPHLQTVGGSKA
jgi:DNA-binding XRE family transcriptional regulator